MTTPVPAMALPHPSAAILLAVHPSAEREFNQAIALAPSYSCAHESRASFLAQLGRREETLAEIREIELLDYGYSSAATVAWAYNSLRDYPRVIEASQRALLLAPDDFSFHYLLGTAYERTGKANQAISEYQKAIDMSGDARSVVGLAHTLAAIGKNAEAETLLRDLGSKWNEKPHSSYTMATIFAGLKETDRAFEFLERAYSEKSIGMPGALMTDVQLDNLRADPRFKQLLQRMSLTAPQG